jgi:hydroxymethylpyrimidine/phosphomethylpyrimidine kinase
VIPTALSIAGSDPSGGAGIQADLKTFLDHRVYGMAAITALTVQDTGGVHSVHVVAPALVADQVSRLLQDLPIGAVKIGMLGHADTADALIEVLQDYAGPIVVDPVLAASDGTPLSPGLDSSALARLLERATVITPNGPEGAILLGARTPEAWARRHGVAVVRTGGHDTGATVVDRLFLPQGDPCDFAHPRIESRNTHGTGCTLSSAIAAQLAQGHDLPAAVKLAVAYTHRLVAYSSQHRLGKGGGPLLHGNIDPLSS